MFWLYAAAERKGYETMADTIGIKNNAEFKLGEHCKPLSKCIYLYHMPSGIIAFLWDDCLLPMAQRHPMCCSWKPAAQPHLLQEKNTEAEVSSPERPEL